MTPAFLRHISVIALLCGPAAQAGGRSCLDFANHAVSKTTRLSDGTVPKTMDKLAGEFSSIKIAGDANLPDLYVCKLKTKSDRCLGFKLTSAPDTDRKGKPSEKRWTLELPIQEYSFHFDVEEGQCSLRSIEVQQRGISTRMKDCKAPEKAYRKYAKKPWWKTFLGRVKGACEVGKDYFPGAQRRATASNQ